MKAIILAGGKGRRLRSVVKDIPKPMAPVAGRPFLEYLILQLKKNKIKEIIISVGYKAEVIKRYFQDGRSFGVHILYAQEHKPLGTAGALKLACGLSLDDAFLVMNGDSFFDCNIRRLISYFKKKNPIGVLALTASRDISRYGKVEIDDKFQVQRFTEKSGNLPGFINTGIYILRRTVKELIPSGRASLESDIFPFLVRRGLYGLPLSGFFVDIGVPGDYLELCRDYKRFISLIGLRGS